MRPKHINILQTFQNKVWRIITKLPRVEPSEALHSRLSKTMSVEIIAQRSQISNNPQIKQFGQYNLIHDKHMVAHPDDKLILGDEAF
jgi:hypothetical protein